MKNYKSTSLVNSILGGKDLAVPTASVGLGLALALAAGPLAAAQITFDSPLLPSPLVAGNWSSATSVPKFDGALGNLTKITFTMNGNFLKGELDLENLDASVKAGVASLTAVLDLKRPDTSSIISVPVTAGATAFLLEPFDGDGSPISPPESEVHWAGHAHCDRPFGKRLRKHRGYVAGGFASIYRFRND